MTDATTSQARIEELLERIDTLEQRLNELERFSEIHHPEGTVSEDVLMAISAACAAYLGKRPVIKQIHRRRPQNWARQGRRAIHSSHSIQI